jgi:type I restriction enzyme, S subunit
MTRAERLDAVCELTMGQAPDGDSYNTDGEGLPLIAGAGDFGEEFPATKKFTRAPGKICREGDIVLGIRATIGEKVVADRDYCLGRGVAGLRAKDGLSSRYLWHWLTHITPALAAKARGATFKQVNREDIGELVIALPELPTQQRISEVLDRAEALRAMRRAALAGVATLRRAIFVDLFGDPATNPKGWSRAKLGDAIRSASDGPHVSPRYVDAGIPFLSTRHVRAGEITWKDLKYISNEDAEVHWRKCRPQVGDVLYTKGGTTGLAAAVRTDVPFAVWVHVALLKLDRTKVEPLWLESMLNTEFCYQQSQNLTRGIANRDLGLTRMTGIDILLPPIARQREFARRAEQVERLNDSSRASLVTLDSLCLSLQRRAFHGGL